MFYYYQKVLETEAKQEELCIRCQKPRSVGNRGRLTQWIFQCSCDHSTQEVLPPVEVQICETCSKRIDGKPGSLTQFIFRIESCSCSEADHGGTGNAIAEETVDEELAAEIEVDADFPLERYCPLEKLGAGSSGSVYLSIDRLLRKRVAVKILERIEDDQVICFQQEARILSKLRHPSIVSVLDFGISELMSPYMVLEYVDGGSLDAMIERDGALEWRTCLELFIQLTDALASIHKIEIFHRDLKPSNILIDEQMGFTRATLIDFGLAAWDKHSLGKEFLTLAGTPYYMSPDQSNGISYYEKSDIYSLGCALFEALTGTKPFVGSTPLETIAMHASSEIPVLADSCSEDLPEQLQSIIETAMAKNPDERFGSMLDFKKSLENALDSSEMIAKTEDTETQGLELSRLKLIVSASLILLVLFAGYSYVPKSSAANPQHRTSDSAPLVMDSEGEDPFNPSNLLPALTEQGYYGNQWVRVKNQIRGIEIADSDLASLELRDSDTALIISGAAINFTGIGLRHIAGHPFAYFKSQSIQFGDDGARYLSTFKELEDICITQSDYLTLTGIKEIASLPRLWRLSLRHMDLPAGTFEQISNIETLARLDLGHSRNVTGAGLGRLSRLEKLEHLSLSGVEIDDQSVAGILKLKQLKSLEINGTKISDRGLRKLAEMKNLLAITLGGETSISKAGLSFFETRNSHCQVRLAQR